jgi:antitoxin HigA-1
MPKSRTTTDEEWSNDPADWLHNPHAGEMLWLEFMEPARTTTPELAAALEVSTEQLQAVIEGSRRMDADLDLRLSRYYGMSEGFFLGLQDDYELLEAKRALKGDLDRIVPRAA